MKTIDLFYQGDWKLVAEAPEPAKRYSPGSVFNVDGGEYMLATIAPQTLVLVSVEDGNRWSDPQKINQKFTYGTYTIEELQVLAPDSNISIVRERI